MNIKSEIAKRIGVAITLGSLWFQYNAVLKVLAIIGIVILVISCIALGFRGRFSQTWWKKLVTVSEFDITFTALALTMALSGTSLLSSGAKAGSSAAVVAGVLIILAGGFFLGGAFGQSISQIISESWHRKLKKR
jgi:hypothetical protein